MCFDPISILITQAMNPSIGHTTIPISYQPTWQQLVTPNLLGKTSVLFSMNVVLLFYLSVLQVAKMLSKPPFLCLSCLLLQHDDNIN
jgi:hypothetical protein